MVPAHPGFPGRKAIKQVFLLLSSVERVSAVSVPAKEMTGVLVVYGLQVTVSMLTDIVTCTALNLS